MALEANGIPAGLMGAGCEDWQFEEGVANQNLGVLELHGRRKMRPFLYSVLSVFMCLGLYTILQASAKERDLQAEQAHKIEHCKQVNERVIRESDEIVAKGKFPSQDQQDNWRQLSEPCKARG